MKRVSLLSFFLITLLSTALTFAQDNTTLYTTTSARVRACPYLTCTIIRTLPTGTSIDILDTEEGSRVNSSLDWYKITFDGKTGYIHSSLTTERVPASAITTTTSRSTPTTPNSATSQPLTINPEVTVTPAAPTHPQGATALCRDGTYSYSQNRRGTCSHHGGVQQWL